MKITSKLTAVEVLIGDWSNRKITKTSYKRVIAALDFLEFEQIERERLLSRFGYMSFDSGEVFEKFLK